MNREQYPQQNTARMEKILGTSSQNGLTTQEAELRLKKYGKNRLGDERRNLVVSFLGTVLKNASLPIAVLGFGGAAFLIGMKVILPAILYAVFFFVYFLLFLIREKGMITQRERLLPCVRVVRDGKKKYVSPETLVVGDLVLLSPGDILYTHAHITTDDAMTVYGQRANGREFFVKHGGDCFDGSFEPFNTLCPGDVIREGNGAAFVTEKAESVVLPEAPSKTLKNHAVTCKVATRVSLLVTICMLGVSLLRSLLSYDYAFLGEAVLLATVLLSTAGTSFSSLLFDLLFLYKNKKNAEKNGARFVSVADTESLTQIDSFVLSTRSMFRSARYVAKHFETASGKRVKEKMKGTAELSVIADALLALKAKCELSMEEEAVLGFAEKHITGRRFELYAKTTSQKRALASYRSSVDGRSFSLVWGDAELLIPGLMYLSESGKTRVLDMKQRELMLSGVRRMKKSGYRLVLFAETQTRNTPEGMPGTFADMKLLGFVALRKVTDEQAMRTLALLKKEKKKVFFVHDGENADWLMGEIPIFDGVPILDGNKDSFREELAYFIKEEKLSFCIGIHLSGIQKAQIVTAFETAGRRVVAYGSRFDDHRMMRAATASIAPIEKEGEYVPPLVLETASVRADEHVSSQIDSVRRAPHLLGGFGVFAAALSASLLGRCAVAFLGAVFGKMFLDASYYAVLGIVFDLLTLYCFMSVDGKRQFEGTLGLIRENRKNFSFFVGFLFGSLVVGALASYLSFHTESFSFAPGSFVFVSLLLMLNVGIWRFSTARETTAAFLYPFVSCLTVAIVFLLGFLTDGRFGFEFSPDVLFWALFPVVALLTAGRLFEAYLEQKNTFHIGEKNERM